MRATFHNDGNSFCFKHVFIMYVRGDTKCSATSLINLLGILSGPVELSDRNRKNIGFNIRCIVFQTWLLSSVGLLDECAFIIIFLPQQSTAMPSTYEISSNCLWFVTYLYLGLYRRTCTLTIMTRGYGKTLLYVIDGLLLCDRWMSYMIAAER